MGPAQAEKAFAKHVADTGKLHDEVHLPADARQELHIEPLGAGKAEGGGTLKGQNVAIPVQASNQFAKAPSGKDSSLVPESKKGIETSQQQTFKSTNEGLMRNNDVNQVKKPTVAPGMKRQNQV